MQRRTFSREFKFEAVNLIRERGVSYAQAARDLDVNVNMLRRWVKEFGSDPKQAFPGLGQAQPPVRLSQEQQAAIRGNRSAIKARRHFLAANGWKIEGKKAILGHGRVSLSLMWLQAIVSATNSYTKSKT